MDDESGDFVFFDGNFGCDIAIRRISYDDVLVGLKRQMPGRWFLGKQVDIAIA